MCFSWFLPWSLVSAMYFTCTFREYIIKNYVQTPSLPEREFLGLDRCIRASHHLSMIEAKTLLTPWLKVANDPS
jgi:hypothetical protein